MSESKNTILNSHELYALTTAREGWSLLYAPLADSLMLASDDDLERIIGAIESPGSASDEVAGVVRSLCETTPVSDRENRIRSAKDFINLSILPNNICNFSCTYCYSAKGRSSQQLQLGQARRIIDYFLSPERNSAPRLTVSIFGGGEPLLSWDSIVRPSVEYLYERAAALKRRVVTTLITNGSVIPADFIATCRTYAIDLVCSYEILEDVQNLQRKHFGTVTGNIAHMISEGVVPAVNAVITDINVTRQCEMIEALHNRFPDIRYVSFEPVIDIGMTDKHRFYTEFASGFLAAMRIAGEYGINLSCSTLRNIDVTVDRYCAGELALCADGSLSVCPCVSSAEEPGFMHYVYGKVTDSEVSVDEKRLHELLSHNVGSQPWCRSCFAKWNCGGGCMNTTIRNGNKPDTDYCRFMKSFLKFILTRRLDKTYIDETGHSITETIGDYGYFIAE